MSYKIALLSDIHGNVTALEAVLADTLEQGVDEYWLLGDTFLPGPADHKVLEKLSDLNVTATLRGNWEDFIIGITKGRFNRRSHSDLYFARMTQYLLERSEKPVLNYINQLPMTVEMERKGLHFHLSHHLPEKNHGRDLLPHEEQENFDRLFADTKADIAIYGHSHHQLLRYSSKGQMIINPGSIGQPYFVWPTLKKDLRAQYAILSLENGGLADLIFRKVDFDIEAEMALAREADLPYQDLYRELLETGILHTHDEPCLKAIHKDSNYVQEVREYFKNRGLDWN